MQILNCENKIWALNWRPNIKLNKVLLLLLLLMMIFLENFKWIAIRDGLKFPDLEIVMKVVDFFHCMG